MAISHFSITSLNHLPEGTYQFQVRAKNAAGWSDFSEIITTQIGQCK